MYVCICNGVTDRDIRQAAEAGCRSLPELTMRTGAGANCGSCLDLAGSLLEQARNLRELPLDVLQPLFAATAVASRGSPRRARASAIAATVRRRRAARADGARAPPNDSDSRLPLRTIRVSSWLARKG